MDVARFRDSPIGEVVPVRFTWRGEPIDHYAFVPAELPGDVPLSEATYVVVSEADQALGLLEGAASGLPNTAAVTRPVIRREAVSTSALEGTVTELSDVLRAEVSESRTPSSDIEEVGNYTAAVEQALAWIEQGRPISLNLIQELHATLLRGTRGDSPDTGRFRTVPVVIGPEGVGPADALFIPPPPGGRMVELLQDWEAWNYAANPVGVIVRAAVSHYQFEAIHPFRDGNGRLGRLLVMLLLMERGPLSSHLLSISPFLEARRNAYGEHLREASATGDFNPWVGFFAEGIRAEAENARKRVAALLRWRDEAVMELRRRSRRGLVIQIAESLIGNPYVTASAAMKRFGVTFRAANRAIGILEEAGIVNEVTGRTYARVFVAPEVLRVISE